MPIYATKTGIPQIGGGSFRVSLRENLPHGAMLAYDATRGVFVDVCTSGVPLSGAVNVGGANAHGVLVTPVLDGILRFKEIVAGSGIDITSDSTTITISRDDQTNLLSVPGDFHIVIDNNNDQNGNARFELRTVRASSDHPMIVSAASISPLTSSAVYAGNTADYGWFRIVNAGDFWSQGFRPGMFVNVENAGDQSGVYQIAEVVREDDSGTITSEIRLTELFSGDALFNLGGPKPSVTFRHFPVIIDQGGLVVPPYDLTMNYCLRIYGVDLNAAGFVPDMVVQILGTSDNDGNYAIAGVEPPDEWGYSALLMHSDTPFLGSDGLQESDLIRLEVREAEVPTGFYVTSGGHLVAPSGRFDRLRVGSDQEGSYSPTEAADVVRNDNLDGMRRRISSPARYFFGLL